MIVSDNQVIGCRIKILLRSHETFRNECHVQLRLSNFNEFSIERLFIEMRNFIFIMDTEGEVGTASQ